MRSWMYRAFFVLVLGLLFEGIGQAQSQPSWIWFQPSSIHQGACYYVGLGNGANMTIDVIVTYPGGTVEVDRAFTMDSQGYFEACVPIDMGVGTYTVSKIRNTLLTAWVDATAEVTITPVNPTDLSIDHTSGYAGTSSACFTLTFADGASMNAQMLYTISSEGYGPNHVWGPWTLDGHGRWSICPGHDDIPRTYRMTAVRNSEGGAGWTDVGPVYWTTLPPQPTSLSFSPTVVNQGGSYVWNVGNGGGLALDVQLTTIPGGAWTGYNVVTLDNNATAHATSGVSADQPLGLIHVTGLKNSANTAWASVDATLQICPNAPTVTNVSPPSGAAGTTVSVTITGTKFYCVSGLAQQTGPGSTITTSGWSTPSNPATSLTATFTIPSGAGAGVHTMRLTAGGGYSDFDFTVVDASTITSISPNNATRGTSGSITIGGTNLSGATLLGPSGVTYSGVSTSATSITATYSVSCTAPVGTGALTVVAGGGSPTWPFTVNNPSTPTISNVSPSSSGPGTNPSVTITGTNLNCATLNPNSWNGLTITGVSSTSSSATATFNVSSSATTGTPSITVTNAAGLTQNTNGFTIGPPPGPSVTGISLSSSPQGASSSVTLYGSNFGGATLSTSWSGLSFSGTSVTGTSVTATYSITSNAMVGTPTITVITSAGSTTIQLFSITGPALSKEYIYLGDRVLAVDGH